LKIEIYGPDHIVTISPNMTIYVLEVHMYPYTVKTALYGHVPPIRPYRTM